MPARSRRRYLHECAVALGFTMAGCLDFDSDTTTIPPRTETTTETRTETPPKTTERTQTQTVDQRTTPTVQTTLVNEDPVQFSLTFQQKDLAEPFLKVDTLTLRGGTGHVVKTHDLGASTEKLEFIRGASDPQHAEKRTWRWFNSPTTIQLPEYPSSGISGFEIKCKPKSVKSPLKVTTHTLRPITETITSDKWQTLYIPWQ